MDGSDPPTMLPLITNLNHLYLAPSMGTMQATKIYISQNRKCQNTISQLPQRETQKQG